jgi:ABC-type uncharacterized transport system permease subunit
MKKIFLLTSFTLMITIYAVNAQSGDSANTAYSSSTTVNTTTTDNSSHPNNTSVLIIGALSIAALGLVIYVMYRNRRKTIGGIQSQDKSSPSPSTTQSINNPGSGV